MDKRIISCFLVAGTLFMVGCSSQEQASSKVAEVQHVDDGHQVARGINELGWDVYQELNEGTTPSLPGNVLISPYSLASALGITYAGAKGDTAKEMARVMHIPQSHADFLPSFMQWVNLFQKAGNDSYILSSANAVWIQDSIKLSPEYKKLLEGDPESIQRIDFKNSDAARNKINAWALARTHDKIRNLLPSGYLDATTKLVLVNALYLKADWLKPFKKEQTRQESFNLGVETTVITAMMHQKERFKMLPGVGFDAIELPYRTAGDSSVELALRIYLPHQGRADCLSSLEQMATSEVFASLPEAAWEERLVNLTLPKFKIESSVELVDVLKELGMKDAFESGKADFSGIDGTHDLVISSIIQKTFLEVDEKGTEAAAATAIVMRKMALGRPDDSPFEFKADHPFLFTLIDKKSGTVLFLGRLTDPR